jgi:hypothetical protein
VLKATMLAAVAVCALALSPVQSASAMPAASSNVLSSDVTVQVKGDHGHGRGHMSRGNRGRHLGWTRGRHRGWR